MRERGKAQGGLGMRAGGHHANLCAVARQLADLRQDARDVGAPRGDGPGGRARAALLVGGRGRAPGRRLRQRGWRRQRRRGGAAAGRAGRVGGGGRSLAALAPRPATRGQLISDTQPALFAAKAALFPAGRETVAVERQRLTAAQADICNSGRCGCSPLFAALAVLAKAAGCRSQHNPPP